MPTLRKWEMYDANGEWKLGVFRPKKYKGDKYDPEACDRKRREARLLKEKLNEK
jgi:hypothetical protein